MAITNDNRQAMIRTGYKVTIVGVFWNIILVVIKLYAGFIGRSQALIADGVHSLSDLFSDLIVMFGLKWGRKEEDSDHPFGHGRIETLSGMIIGIILLLVGVGIVYDSIKRLYAHEHSVPSLFAIGVAFISIVIKEALYWYTLKVGKKIKSAAIVANAWHHRSDAFSSIAVLFGVTGAFIHPDWVLADVLAALFVTFFIVKVGWQMIWQGVKEIIDTAPSKDVVIKINKTAAKIEGVRQVHDTRARFHGGQILVEMHIVVDPNITVFEGHEISAAVKYAVLDEIDDVQRVIIHIDPEINPTPQLSL